MLLDLGERAGHDLGARLRRSTRRGGGGRRGGLGRFGLFGAKARSARVTEAPVGGVRVREGGGACRSRVRDGAARAVGGGTSGRGRYERSEVGREARRSGRDRDLRGWCTSCIRVNRPFELCRISPKVHYPDGVVCG